MALHGRGRLDLLSGCPHSPAIRQYGLFPMIVRLDLGEGEYPMTESEWLDSEDPQMMLEFLEGMASDRKLRLFAVACCRRLWHLLRETPSRQAVLTAERFADGLATRQELEDAQEKAVDAGRQGNGRGSLACCHLRPDGSFPVEVARYVAEEMIEVMDNRQGLSDKEWRAQFRAEAEVLKDILGNPFRPITLDPTWLSSDVVSIAQMIYEDRAFDRMPEVADALDEAGCHDADLLGHCRQAGTHARGCWVVDLILGKS
jgi:hypothetical protein